jgi:hypothetical protein
VFSKNSVAASRAATLKEEQISQDECQTGISLEQVALAWGRAADVSLDETQLAAWRNAAHTG